MNGAVAVQSELRANTNQDSQLVKWQFWQQLISKCRTVKLSILSFLHWTRFNIVLPTKALCAPLRIGLGLSTTSIHELLIATNGEIVLQIMKHLAEMALQHFLFLKMDNMTCTCERSRIDRHFPQKLRACKSKAEMNIECSFIQWILQVNASVETCRLHVSNCLITHYQYQLQKGFVLLLFGS